MQAAASESARAHVPAGDVGHAGLEAHHAVAQAVHDGLALPRHALGAARAPVAGAQGLQVTGSARTGGLLSLPMCMVWACSRALDSTRRADMGC